MVTLRWSVAGLIHYNFINSSRTITVENYYQKIDEICQKLFQVDIFGGIFNQFRQQKRSLITALGPTSHRSL